MNSETTRRSFIKTSAAFAAGSALLSGSEASLKSAVEEIEQAELGEIRYIHVQCNRPDGPSLEGALTLVEDLTGPIESEFATACGDAGTRKHFLIHQPLKNGGMVVFTSARQHSSWGIIRGEAGEIELA